MPSRVHQLLLAAILAAWGPAALAQELRTLETQFGALTYQFYCEACHGASGRGDGPLAHSLQRPPADLTQLARDNGGVFPQARVTAAIDGRLEVAGHLDLSMPPWAQLFAYELQAFEGSALEALIARRIANLVAFIETLQDTGQP